MSDAIVKPAHYYNAPRKEMIPLIPRHAKTVLELGCGDGCFGAALKHSFAASESQGALHITGIEVDEVCAERARFNIDRVLVANLDDVQFEFQDESFDCIVCNDVLEHLRNPWEILKHVLPFLSNNGCVVASIPNVRYWGVLKNLLFDGDWRYTGEGVLDITHLRFFTKHSIQRMFEEAGFDEIKIIGINSLVRGWKFDLLRMISLGRLDDIQYLQYAVVARKNKEN